MKPFCTLLFTTVLSGALIFQPALAADQKAATPAKPDMAVEVGKEYHKQLRQGNLMIGHISMALRALDYSYAEGAKKDIAEALKLAKELEKGAPEIRSKEAMSFGKLSHEHEEKPRISTSLSWTTVSWCMAWKRAARIPKCVKPMP